MQARTFAVSAAVLLTLVLGAQLGFTGVGQPVGERWTAPTTAVSLPTADDRQIVELAAAGDGDNGAVAWIARSGDRYSVTVIDVDVVDGRVSLGQRRTVTNDTIVLQGLDLAVEGDVRALTWERAVANDVILYRSDDGRSRIVSDDPLRVVEPSVAILDGEVLLAWQQWAGSRYRIETARVDGETVSYHPVELSTGGAGSPAIDAVADGVVLTWFDDESRSTKVAFGRVDRRGLAFSSPRALGRARPSGGFSGGTGSMSVGAGAHRQTVRGIWLDLGRITSAAVTRGGSVSGPTTLGPGDRPQVAVRDGRWLAAWVITRRAADTDIAYAAGGDGRMTGPLSRFQSSANHPNPFFAPEAAVAWSELGAESRVLISSFREAPDRRYLARLGTEPGRLAFIAIGAIVVGAVTVPIMPWVFVSMLVAFYATNRFIRQRAIRGLAALSGLAGGSSDEWAVREELDAVPPVAWAAVFGIVEMAILLFLLPRVGTTVSLSFAGPVPLSIAAGLGTGAVQFVSPQKSPWRIVALFVYFQTAALWATALPGVL